jgi:hypothetical protein
VTPPRGEGGGVSLSTARTPFRTLFLLRNKFENIQVVPLGSTRAHGRTVLGGALSGREELLAFVRDIGFDSIVESFQVSDVPHPSFLGTYHLAPSPDAIVRLLDRRLEAEPRCAHKILDLDVENSPEQLTLSPHEAFQLGATTFDADEGIQRISGWFEERAQRQT